MSRKSCEASHILIGRSNCGTTRSSSSDILLRPSCQSKIGHICRFNHAVFLKGGFLWHLVAMSRSVCHRAGAMVSVEVCKKMS